MYSAKCAAEDSSVTEGAALQFTAAIEGAADADAVIAQAEPVEKPRLLPSPLGEAAKSEVSWVLPIHG